jgi:hypothetical protein
MAVLTDAAPCGSVAGRTLGWRWTVLLPAVQCGRAVVSARPCRGRGCRQRRASAGCRYPQAASAVHARPDRGCRPAAPTWLGTQQVSAEPDTAAVSAGRLRLRPAAGQTAAIRRGHGRGSPEQGGDLAVAGGGPSWTPAGDGSGRQPPHTVSTAAAEPRRGRLSRRGCPPHGMLPQPADTARVSAVLPELRPPGDAVRTAGVRHGYFRRLRGVCCYRKRSPARRPLDGCRHRQYARAS